MTSSASGADVFWAEDPLPTSGVLVFDATSLFPPCDHSWRFHLKAGETCRRCGMPIAPAPVVPFPGRA